MLTPEKMTKLANNRIVDIYTELNQKLTNEIIKQLKKDGDLSSYTKAQLKVLKKQGGLKIFFETLKSVQGITKERKEELKELFDEVAEEQFKGYKPQYDYSEVDYKLSNSTRQMLDSVVRRTEKELKNMTKSVAFSTQKTYIQAIDDLYTKVISGGWDYERAMKSTLDDLTEKGITLEHDGRNYSLESSVKMNLFTSIKQTADNISEQIKDDIGANAVWIAPTPYCRPSHRVINGVVMDLKEFKKHEYLTEEPNCYHIVNYVVKEAFEPPLSKKEINTMNNKADEVYKNRQKQNYYARQVRQKKKEIASLGTSSKDVLKSKKTQLRNAQIKYRTFSQSKGLNVDYFQTWEAGYNANRNR